MRQSCVQTAELSLSSLARDPVLLKLPRMSDELLCLIWQEPGSTLEVGDLDR